jgi:hypothetical protein
MISNCDGELENPDTDFNPESDTITVKMDDCNEISFPFGWVIELGFEIGYVQVTLVDDRIVIHKPTTADIEYKAPCKAGEDSYIRKLSLFSVRIPKLLLQKLGITYGDKVDLTLEENCMSIRKNMGEEPVLPVVDLEMPEPVMAFCCVCGNFYYTENGLVKVAAKYICHDCIDLVKSM